MRNTRNLYDPRDTQVVPLIALFVPVKVAHIWRTQDENGSTVLMAVVRSRSPNVLKAVLRSMMEDLSGDQVRYPIFQRNIYQGKVTPL